MDRGINGTFITLIQKKPEALKVGEYHLISLCNTFYKVIAKILSNRLASVLGRIVGKEQTAFVQGRRIQDNIIMAHELLKGFGSKFAKPKCISSVWFLVIVNGSPYGFFQPERGLKHGCPLSSLLFTLVIEYFSGTIAAEVQCGKIIPTQAAIQAGLAISKEKSEVFLIDFVERRVEIVRSLGCKVGNFPFTYLGVPIFDKMLHTRDCNDLIDKATSQPSGSLEDSSIGLGPAFTGVAPSELAEFYPFDTSPLPFDLEFPLILKKVKPSFSIRNWPPYRSSWTFWVNRLSKDEKISSQWKKTRNLGYYPY
ncbi:uncharacterized protein LOC132280802 [Cornus florida]|uniref:uncharacterized protein LOC132280802 n=1 Tax=Cornus florida TaxID=4283 RepID=UPI0028967D0B|nr:uncharacterized protein LOC132280802 [Cornus florida]